MARSKAAILAALVGFGLTLVGLWVWSRPPADRESPPVTENADVDHRGGGARRAGPEPTAGDDSTQDGPRRAIVAGTVRIYENRYDTTLVQQGSVEFHLSSPRSTRELTVPIRDGRWQLELDVDEIATPSSAEIDGRRARPFSSTTITAQDETPTILVAWLDDLRLDVLDAASGRHVSAVRIVRDARARDGSRGPFDSQHASSIVGEADSPVFVPRQVGTAAYWIGAEGYEWTRLVVEPNNMRREVRLEPGCIVELECVTAGDPGAYWVEVREASGRMRVIWRTESASDLHWSLSGLPATTLAVRAGRPSEAAVTRCCDVEKIVVTRPRAAVHVRLELTESRSDDLGSLEVTVVPAERVPAETPTTISIREATPGGETECSREPTVTVRMPGLRPGRSWRHRVEGIRPGPAQVEVRPYGLVVPVDVPRGSIESVTADLSRCTELHVAVVESGTRKSVRGSRVSTRPLDSYCKGDWSAWNDLEAGSARVFVASAFVEIAASAPGRPTVSKEVRLQLGDSVPTVTLELDASNYTEFVVLLRLQDEPIAADAEVWSKLSVEAIQGTGKYVGMTLLPATIRTSPDETPIYDCSSVRASVSEPGRYRISMPPFGCVAGASAVATIGPPDTVVTLRLQPDEK